MADDITRLMMEHGIERVVYVPASDLVPRHSFHAWPFGAVLSKDMGDGPTAEAAIHDAVAKAGRVAA